MLNTIGQIADNGVNTWAAGNFLQVQIGLAGIAMCQHKHARCPLAPNLEQVAPSRATAAFIQLFEGDVLALQILPDKNRA